MEALQTLRQIGPFAVGHTLADAWLVESLAITSDGFVVALSGQHGRARFEVTCARSEHRSPFDLGPAHIFYSRHVEFRVLEAAGWALQRQVRDAAEGHDICDALTDWRLSAQ